MLQHITQQMNQHLADLGEQLNATMKANFMEAFKLLQPDTITDENKPPLRQALR